MYHYHTDVDGVEIGRISKNYVSARLTIIVMFQQSETHERPYSVVVINTHALPLRFNCLFRTCVRIRCHEIVDDRHYCNDPTGGGKKINKNKANKNGLGQSTRRSSNAAISPAMYPFGPRQTGL